MKPSSSIYKLINSLDKKEKRHLRSYISRHKDNSNFVELFEAIENMATTDERHLKDNLNGKIAKNLPYYKNKLFNVIVRALCDYNYNEKPSLNLLYQYKQADLLLNKKLYKESKKIILKAKKEATEAESFLELVKFNRLYTWILKAETTGAEHEEEREEIQEENLATLKKLVNYQEYENLAQKAYKLHRLYSQNIEPNLLEKIEKLMQNPLMASPDQAISKLAKLLFYQIRNTFHLGKDKRQSIEDYENILHLFETNPKFLVPRIRTYINAQLNYITNLIHAQQFEAAESALEKFLETPKKHKQLFDQWLLVRHKHSYLHRILMLHTTSGQSQNIVQYIPEIKQILIKKDWTPSRHNDAYLYYYLIKGLLAECMFEECLDWINRFHEYFKEKDFVIAIRSSILLMEVLVHFKLEHFSLAQSITLKLRRYFQEMGIYGEDERQIISCLNKGAKNLDKIELKEHFTPILRELNCPEKPPSMVLSIFIPYLKSQLQGKTLKEMILFSFTQQEINT